MIMIGIQGSGKSEFCRRYLKNEFVRINLDTLRTRNKEKMLLQECLEAGRDFAVDNTNPTRSERARYIGPAKDAGYRVIGYFMESKLRACITRNNLRKGKEKIPPQAIAATSNRLELPSLEEGFDELYFVANDGENMTVSPWKQEG